MFHLYDFLKKHALENPLTYAFMARRTGKTTLSQEMANLFYSIGYRPILFVRDMRAIREKTIPCAMYTIQEWRVASVLGDVLICDDCTSGLEQIAHRPETKLVILRTPFYDDADGQYLRGRHLEHWRIWFDEYPQGNLSNDFYASQIQARSRDWVSDPSCHEVKLETFIRKP